VVVVAEGCGARLSGGERDASGNVRYASAGADIGPVLRDRIIAKIPRANVKYIDPSYMLRGVPANASDSIFAGSLARSAAHAGMAGKTDLLVGRWHRVFTHVPLALATAEKKRIDPRDRLWQDVLETTGQGPLSTG
jgi:6-phosphofructokinase 1